MNRVEKEIAQAQLQAEERTLTELKVIFNKAKADVQHRISELNTRQEMQDLQSIVYQKKYQEAILKQIESTLQELQSGQYKTAEQFLHDSYDNGYIGMMYSLQNQGIPITIPIDDRKVVRALTTDSQLVRRYYEADPLKGRLAENYDLLKTRVRTNLSRGVAQGQSWLQVATNIATGMNNPFDIAFRDAMRIVRTEGHRVNQQGFIDAGDEAKKKGADIVKQWDATLDSKTRPAHQEADGQIQEWDDDFIVGGEHLKAPSIGGSAWNVINCRCQLLQRAKWALNEAELKTLEDRAKFFDLDKSDSFKDFKEKYLKLPEDADTVDLSERRKQRLLERQQQKLTIDGCTTVEQVEKLFKDSGWYYETTLNTGTLFRSVDGMSLNGCSLEVAKGVYKQQESLFSRFPQLIGKLNAISTDKLARNTYAQCHYGLGHGGVQLNTIHFSNLTKLVESYERDKNALFHPQGTTWSSIVTHEFGHAVDDYLTNTLKIVGMNKNGWSPKKVSAYLRPRVMKACNLASNSYQDIKQNVSEYATQDALEWFAECFAEYVDSPNPRPVAQEFGKQLEELLKGVE